MADSTVVQIPVEAAGHLKDAIRSVRAAGLALEPWLTTQPAATQAVVRRVLRLSSPFLALAEPLVVQSEEP